MNWIEANKEKPQVDANGVSDRVIVFVPEFREWIYMQSVHFGTYHSRCDAWKLTTSPSWFEVSHWMPLPDEPDEQGPSSQDPSSQDPLEQTGD